MERRKEMRFPVSLKIEAIEKKEDSTFGLLKNFSRDGLRAVFNVFEPRADSLIELKIQRPNQEGFAPVCAEVRWKRPVEGRWEVGFRFKDFIPLVKSEILDYSYKNWLKGLNLSAVHT